VDGIIIFFNFFFFLYVLYFLIFFSSGSDRVSGAGLEESDHVKEQLLGAETVSMRHKSYSCDPEGPGVALWSTLNGHSFDRLLCELTNLHIKSGFFEPSQLTNGVKIPRLTARESATSKNSGCLSISLSLFFFLLFLPCASLGVKG
jgi:hypothetical protein